VAAYKQYRLEQRRKFLRSAIDTLETQRTEQVRKIQQAEKLVDRLRTELKLPDAVLSENMPEGIENNRVLPISAETLRHIEGLRIESLAEYMKQRALLDRLEQLDPKDLPATILTIGVQDNPLVSLSESLALVEQRLVSLQKELGPEHTEFVKAAAQQEDLKQKIKSRTSGILLGLQAKCESTATGLAALSNAVYSAMRRTSADITTASSSRPYFEAKRNLEELQRFGNILQAKLAQEATDLQLTEDGVDLIEEAVAPIQAVAPNRSRAMLLLATGTLLVVLGWLLARAGRPASFSLKPA
jgi:hypothetical protein